MNAPRPPPTNPTLRGLFDINAFFAVCAVGLRPSRFSFNRPGRSGHVSFDMDCGGKREHGRDAALVERDSRRPAISKRNETRYENENGVS